MLLQLLRFNMDVILLDTLKLKQNSLYTCAHVPMYLCTHGFADNQPISGREWRPRSTVSQSGMQDAETIATKRIFWVLLFGSLKYGILSS
jgi:hypothetical protein